MFICREGACNHVIDDVVNSARLLSWLTSLEKAAWRTMREAANRFTAGPVRTRPGRARLAIRQGENTPPNMGIKWATVLKIFIHRHSRQNEVQTENLNTVKKQNVGCFSKFWSIQYHSAFFDIYGIMSSDFCQIVDRKYNAVFVIFLWSGRVRTVDKIIVRNNSEIRRWTLTVAPWILTRLQAVIGQTSAWVLDTCRNLWLPVKSCNICNRILFVWKLGHVTEYAVVPQSTFCETQPHTSCGWVRWLCRWVGGWVVRGHAARRVTDVLSERYTARHASLTRKSRPAASHLADYSVPSVGDASHPPPPPPPAAAAASARSMSVCGRQINCPTRSTTIRCHSWRQSRRPRADKLGALNCLDASSSSGPPSRRSTAKWPEGQSRSLVMAPLQLSVFCSNHVVTVAEILYHFP